MAVKSVFLSVLGATTAVGMAVGGYYFVKPKYIKDLLLKEGKKLLDTSENSTKDDDKWEKLVEKHNAQEPQADLGGNKKLTISGSEWKIDKKKLKEECKKLLNKPITDNDKETNKQNAINWCTKDSPLLDDKKLVASR